jgi:transcriptional regulator with XRE-family HTH domain
MAKELLTEVARRLAIIRLELDLTQDQMAEYLDIGRTRWMNWEGAKNFPSPVITVRLCEHTGVTFDYIFRGLHAGLPQALSVRLAIREQGGDPDAPEFQGVRARRARRAKSGV